MLDKDMREPLFDYLDTEFGKVRTIEEKIIKKSRADVLAITDGAIIGIEIKSDADTYTRLATQVKDYDKYCDYCYIAVGESHRLHAAEHVPSYWGIISVELIKGEVDFYRVREAKHNPKARIRNKMTLLWKSEFSHILAENDMPKYAQKSKKFIAEKLMAKVPEDILNRQISDELFERDYTIYD